MNVLFVVLKYKFCNVVFDRKDSQTYIDNDVMGPHVVVNITPLKSRSDLTSNTPHA